MSDYANTISWIMDLCDEFTIQLFIIALQFIPALKHRSMFFLRYCLCCSVIFIFEHMRQLGYIPIPEAVNYILMLGMLIVSTAVCFQVNVYQSMFIATCIYCCQFIISNTCYTLIYILIHFTGNWDNWSFYYIIMPVAFLIFIPIIYFLLVKRIRKSDLIFNNKTIIYIVLMFALVATTLSFFARREIESLPGQIYLLSIASLFTLSTLIVGFQNSRNRQLEEDNIVLQQLLKKDKQRYEEAKLANEKIQIKYHDMKLHENNDIVDFESLREVESDNEILRSMYFTGNNALDVILSEKAMMCERLGITLLCTANGSLLNFMKAHHIYSLIGNALQNAIECLKDEKKTEHKQLTISITQHGNMCIIRTENHVSHTVEMDQEGMPITQKSDKANHGYGTKSMKEVVNRYSGQIMFSQKENIFTMVAMLPLKQNGSKES